MSFTSEGKPSDACFSGKTVVHRGCQNLSSPLFPYLLSLTLYRLITETWEGRLSLGCLLLLKKVKRRELERFGKFLMKFVKTT